MLEVICSCLFLSERQFLPYVKDRWDDFGAAQICSATLVMV